MQKEFFQRNGFRILLIVVFLLSFIWMGSKKTIQSNSNSVEDWLPDQYQETGDYKWFLKHFPFESFVVVSWDGCTLDNDKIELFAQKLVPGRTIDNFSLAVHDNELRAELELDLPQERLAKLKEMATANQPVSETFRPPEGNRRGDTLPGSASAQAKTEQPKYFKSVMTGPRLIRLLEELYEKTPRLELTKEELRADIINRLRGILVGPDGKSTAAIITLEKGKRDGKTLRKVLDEIRHISTECGLPDTTNIKTGSLAWRFAANMYDVFDELINGRHVRMDGLILGGPPTDNVALDQEGQRTLFRLAGLCALVGGSLALICLRSIRLTMFVFWVSVLSAGFALAIVSFTGGTCDSILLSMPALIYVLAMSGAIHFINYYHDAIRENGLPGAPERALEHAFTPCFFAQFTTAIGLGSLYTSGLIPITKFGVYSAIGVMTTLLLVFLYLPALLYFYPSVEFARRYGGRGAEGEKGFSFRFWDAFGKLIVRWHNPVAILCFIVMIFFAYQLPQIKTSVKMMSFFSSDAEIIKHYGFLEEKLGPLVPMELVISFDNSRLGPNTYGTAERLGLINRIGNALKTELSEDVGGTLSVGMFAPDIDSLWEPGSITWRMGAAVVRKSIDQNREGLKDYLAIEGNPSLVELRDAFKPEEPEYSALNAARNDLEMNGIHDLEGIMSMSPDRAYRNLDRETIKKIQTVCKSWQERHGIELWRISIRVWSLKKDIDYSQFIADVKRVVEPVLEKESATILASESGPAPQVKTAGMGPGHQHDIIHPAGISAKYTGMVPLVYKTQHELINGLVYSLFTAFLMISVVMILVLRSVSGGLVAMIPNVFPVIVVFGYMAWRGILVDVGTMMTASVALGVAIDDTMHYLTWYSHGIHQGLSPKTAAIGAYKRCAVAMTESTIICGLGLSVFAFSTFVPTQKFGILMLSILFVAEIGDLVFLPALLTGPLGKYFVLKKRKGDIDRIKNDVPGTL